MLNFVVVDMSSTGHVMTKLSDIYIVSKCIVRLTTTLTEAPGNAYVPSPC